MYLYEITIINIMQQQVILPKFTEIDPQFRV